MNINIKLLDHLIIFVLLAMIIIPTRKALKWPAIPKWAMHGTVKDYIISIMGSICIYTVYITYMWISDTTPNEHDQVLVTNNSLILVLTRSAIFAAINEEVIFRGMLLSAMLWAYSKVGQPEKFQIRVQYTFVVILAALFSLLHTQYGLPIKLYLFILGVWFGIMRVWKNSLILPIVAHGTSGILGVLGAYFSFP